MSTWYSLLAFLAVSATAAQLPWDFLERRCFDCHDSASQKGDLDLEAAATDWSQRSTEDFWIRVLDAVEDELMPPPDKTQPSAGERKAATAALHASLAIHSQPGGSVIRRLNRREYERSVRALLGVPFEVPAGFPADGKRHGFDNNAAALVLSPPLLERYFEAATLAADTLLPPAREVANIEPVTVTLTPADFSMNFEGSQLRSDAMRLVSRNEVLVRSCSWPTRFEAKHAGRYRIETTLRAFKPENNTPLKVDLLVIRPSMTFTSTLGLRRAASFELPADGMPHRLSAEFALEPGETVAFYWANSSFGWSKAETRETSTRQFNARFRAYPKLYRAWLAIGGFDRQRTPKRTWAALKEAMEGELPPMKALPKGYPATSRRQLMWTFENMHMELGPALDILDATFVGPFDLRPSKEEAAQARRAERFLGPRMGRSDEEWTRNLMVRLLAQAFRRPPTDGQVETYVALVLAHIAEGHRFEDGIHLAIRSMLCSPHFLYRGYHDGPLDDYDLAARLSFFLEGGPPGKALLKLAEGGRLSKPEVRAAQAEAMLEKRAKGFLDPFLDQWLDLNLLAEIMPDERLMRWTDKERDAIDAETRLFVGEILRDNLPLSTFIDPDFTYLNARNAKLYGRKDIKDEKMQRVSLPRGGRFGGLLGQASIMMATANGVDTQPVLRGAWIAENILGDAPPPPPANVPAVEPDTSGATSIREQLTRHQADPSCAGCHAKIDPLGYVLENFDPIGRWRVKYPGGLPVDSQATLADGRQVADVQEFKRLLAADIDPFAACLAEKILRYATGREPSYADRQILQQLVRELRKSGGGFRDLIVAVVASEAFAVR